MHDGLLGLSCAKKGNDLAMAVVAKYDENVGHYGSETIYAIKACLQTVKLHRPREKNVLIIVRDSQLKD